MLTTRAWQLGSAHPPGYCGFLHLLHMVQKILPIGDISCRSNQLGIILSAISAFALCRLMLRSQIPLSIAVPSAAGFSLCLPVFNAIGAVEVYAMHLLFIIITMSLCLIRSSKKQLFLLAFICSIAFTHHLTFILLIPGLITWFLCQPTLNLKKAHWITLLILILLGSSINIYFPIRESVHSLIVWGQPDSADGFFDLVTASEEARSAFSSGLAARDDIWSRLLAVWRILLGTLSLPGLVLAVPGVIGLTRKSIGFMALTFVTFVCLTVSVIIYNSNETISFFLPSLLIAWLWSTFGLSDIVTWMRKNTRIYSKVIAHVLAVLPILMLSVIFNQLWNHRHNDVFVPRILVKTAIDSCKQNALIITRRSDLCFIRWYMNEIEKRSDQQSIFQHLLSFKWYYHDLVQKGLMRAGLENVVFEDSQAWNAAVTASLAVQNQGCRQVFFSDPEIVSDIELAGWQFSRLECKRDGMIVKSDGIPPASGTDKPLIILGRLDEYSTQALGALYQRYAICLAMQSKGTQASEAMAESERYHMHGIDQGWWK
ncbi:DUF2723 domain-containing protein [bacterium]|nr:DUF2723 domain-containing protein [candidate division CSSED10-310 bacterium]